MNCLLSCFISTWVLSFISLTRQYFSSCAICSFSHKTCKLLIASTRSSVVVYTSPAWCGLAPEPHGKSSSFNERFEDSFFTRHNDCLHKELMWLRGKYCNLKTAVGHIPISKFQLFSQGLETCRLSNPCDPMQDKQLNISRWMDKPALIKI